MTTIRRIIQSDVSKKETNEVVQLKVNDATDFQSSGYNSLMKDGFYFRRPKSSF